MSFLNNLNSGGLWAQFSGAPSEQAVAAASDHVQSMDAGELAGHLVHGVQNMDSGQLSSLAISLLGALTNHGHDEATVQAAGISTDDAQAGDGNALSALIAHAQHNPGALKDAAVDFIKTNPQAVEQFAPDFLNGIIAKIAAR